MDEKPAQGAVATLRHAEQRRLAPGGVLAWNEAEPRREIATALEAGAIGDSGDQRRGNLWADTGDGEKASAAGISSRDRFDLLGHRGDVGVESAPLTP